MCLPKSKILRVHPVSRFNFDAQACSSTVRLAMRAKTYAKTI